MSMDLPIPTEAPAAKPSLVHLREGGDRRLLLSVPSPRAAVRHVLPALVEGVIGPVAIFYLSLVFAGFTGALWCAFGWSVLVLVRRLLARQHVPGTVWMSVGLLGARTVIALVTKSAVIYFLQPTLSTIVVGLVFLVSAGSRRPFIARLAQDFCPLPAELLARDGMRRFFTQISLLWATVMLVNAGVVLGLLLTSSLRAFVLERTIITWGLSAAAVAASVYAFARTLSGEGIRLHFGGHRA